MFKIRTWLLSLALALGWASLATAAPPESVAYTNGYMGGSMYAGGMYNGGCANGACAARGGNITTGDCGHCRQNCPPPYRHCVEGPPHLRFRRGCPAPVCSPCDAPNWGYFQPCWNPWPWPPDWSHCPVTPPAAHVVPGPIVDDLGVPPGPALQPRRGGL